MDAEPLADGGHDSAHGVRRREQQPAPFHRAELYGNGHGDLRRAPALDCDFSHGAVDPGDDSLLHPMHPKETHGTDTRHRVGC